jgi:hypothetical protein
MSQTKLISLGKFCRGRGFLHRGTDTNLEAVSTEFDLDPLSSSLSLIFVCQSFRVLVECRDSLPRETLRTDFD